MIRIQAEKVISSLQADRSSLVHLFFANHSFHIVGSFLIFVAACATLLFIKRSFQKYQHTTPLVDNQISTKTEANMCHLTSNNALFSAADLSSDTAFSHLFFHFKCSFAACWATKFFLLPQLINQPIKRIRICKNRCR